MESSLLLARKIKSLLEEESYTIKEVSDALMMVFCNRHLGDYTLMRATLYTCDGDRVGDNVVTRKPGLKRHEQEWLKQKSRSTI